jgi:hypothetical protein
MGVCIASLAMTVPDLLPKWQFLSSALCPPGDVVVFVLLAMTATELFRE